MGFQTNIITLSINYIVPAAGNEYTILMDCSGGERTITLPVPDDTIKGRFWVIKKIDSSINKLIINTADVSVFIDSASQFEINTQNESITVTNDGDVNWIIV